ncbi:MAG: RNA polymerase sigma factor RpoD/SigA [Bacteroidaceae bacterium]|nr:RNA polymerase sigma factor RpoD/SigA [Bacteroidaceae bacterium]
MRQLKINTSITVRSEGLLEKYLNEISRIPMITTEEEVELAQAIHAGGVKGEQAKEKLIKANLRFVVSVAKQYQNHGVPLSDLINEGNIGLTIAVGRYDEKRGFKFISYAVWWIRQSIINAIAEYGSTIHRPLSQIGLCNKIKNATNAFILQNQRKPSAEELSEIISLEIEKIEKAQESEVYIDSIDMPIRDDDSLTLGDQLCTSTEHEADFLLKRESLHTDLMRLLSIVLDDRERYVIIHSFGIGCPERSLDDIGREKGLTRERVRQIRERGLSKIRKSHTAKMFLFSHSINCSVNKLR